MSRDPMSHRKPKFIYRVLKSIYTITFLYLPILAQLSIVLSTAAIISLSSIKDVSFISIILICCTLITSLVFGIIIKRVKKEAITNKSILIVTTIMLIFSLLMNVALLIAGDDSRSDLYLPSLFLSLNFPIFVLLIALGNHKIGITLIIGSYFCFIVGLISAYGVKDNILKTSPSIRNLFLLLTLSMMVMMLYFINFGIN